jgi:hypothetical protein
MADNTILNVGASGDVIRDLARASGASSGSKTQVVQLDQGGANTNAESLVSLTNPLASAQSQTNFYFSAGNSSTAQLASGTTFTGSMDSVINQNALSLLIESDEPTTVQINQYISNTDTVASSTETYQAFPTVGGYGISKAINLNGNYVQLLVTNNGIYTTTKLNINTYYGTIPQSSQVIGTFNQVNGQIDTLENGDNANDFDAPNNVNPNEPTTQFSGLIGSETYPRVFDGVNWQRQRGSITTGMLTYDQQAIDLLTQILKELRVHSFQMQQYGNTSDASDIREDPNLLN